LGRAAGIAASNGFRRRSSYRGRRRQCGPGRWPRPARKRLNWLSFVQAEPARSAPANGPGKGARINILKIILSPFCSI